MSNKGFMDKRIRVFTTSLSHRGPTSCLDWWHSAELFGSAAAGGVGTAAGSPAVALEPEDFTVLSYKDTMLWKAAGGPGCDEVSFFNVTLAG
ncbi:hypothetical protein EYF80_042780 [Liparis tanakae]|uniref:Uncharacterized protein n=1 Tax=Liparis tanakae TaxID=230148 RepID=A0A4Z2G0G3_9TELE|nr:hypothetical protein EYF80_042780 [Liparis tanakae]